MAEDFPRTSFTPSVLGAQRATYGRAQGPFPVGAVDVVGLDWNCPQNITPRHTEAEIDEYTAALRARINTLEQQLAESSGERA